MTEEVGAPVRNFEQHIPLMEGFHRRYMTGNRACRLWAGMVRKLKPKKIVPQHGSHFEGENIEKFLTWIEHLECGLDLLTEQSYRVPDGLR